jgi:hypothetical protein
LNKQNAPKDDSSRYPPMTNFAALLKENIRIKMKNFQNNDQVAE